jgi:two-component system, NtrC family, response regulator AtoC
MTDRTNINNLKHRVLIVDDELEYCLSMKDLFEESGFSCSHSTDPERVLDLLKSCEIDIILLDQKMPRMSGIDLLKKIRIYNSRIPVIMVSGHIDIETTVQAMQIGAMNVLKKPVRFSRMLEEISGILKPHSEASHVSNTAVFDSPIICSHKGMLEIIHSLKKVAKTNAPVLITGESGTGKELIADEIHRLSQRSDKKFVKLNCASLPESLLESELFGHKKGAFTGADKDRPGRFNTAHKGSMFLDEIGDMSLMIQAKLLRVLQDSQVTALGADEPKSVDVRIITATNKDLQHMMSDGKFREDLYYRLSVVHFELPPLRERKGDILLLAEAFREQACREYGRQISGFDPEVQNLLLSHLWPGNIRELKNCVQRSVIFCENDLISIEDLPAQYKDIPSQGWSDEYERAIDNINKELIEEALRKSQGKKTMAAELLNMDRKTLYNKMKKLNIRE